jgi:cell pole-organizing protein PopZ
MSTDKSDQEPSMEEILSSIRRIIADDEEDGAPGKKAPADARPEPKKAPAEQETEDDDVLDLTQVVARGTDAAEPKVEEEPVDEVELEEDVEPEPAIKPDRAAAERSMSDEDTLVSAAAASASTGAFAKLTKVASSSGPAPVIGGDKTVEAFLVELLRPMLKEWLDANLESVVQRVVEQEVKKLARRAELM